MKKVSLLLAALTFACVSVFGDYSQVLPLNYEDFFRADAVAEGGAALERDVYTGTTQGTGVIKVNQWNRGGKSGDDGGENPAIAASTLAFGSYIDNRKGSEIQLAKLSTGTRASIYSMQEGSTYSEQPFYVALLVQISSVTSSTADIFACDGNYTANAQRARMYIGPSGSGYKIGVGWNAAPSDWSPELEFGSTHLVVIKVTPDKENGTDAESAVFYLDPDLDAAEADQTPVSTVVGNGLKSVRGLTVRQRSNCAGKIAGLRFGASWADVVKAAEVPTGDAIDNIDTKLNDGTWGDAAASYTSGSYPSSTINGFQLTAAGLQTGSQTYDYGDDEQVTYQYRISMDKNTYGGAIEFPLLTSVQKVVVYASSGSADKSMTLQQFSYGTNKWNDVASYQMTSQDCFRFETVLNSDEITRLRLVNADGSIKYIWRIVAYPIVTLDRITTDLSDKSTWGTPAASITDPFPSSEIAGFSLVKAGLENKSIMGPAGEAFTPRITVDKKSNGGMIICPAVTGVYQVDVYASVGGSAHTFTLDAYDYNKDKWATVETFECETTGICYRFSKVLNSDQVTKLRIANADGSAKYIWKIVTYPTAPTDLAVPASPEVANVAAHSFTAKWTAVEGASGYRVVVFNNDGSRKTTQEIEGGEIFQFNFKNLNPSTAYTFKIAAKGDGETTIDSELSDAVAVTTAPEINDVYTRPVTNGNYGTICLPKASDDLSAAGAVFFKVAGKIMDGSKLTQIVFDEVTSLEAGKPYVFQATSDELNIPLTDDAVAEPDNSSSNGLFGAFTVAKVPNSVYVYVLSNNLLYCAKGQAYFVGENRAYFDISQMDAFGGAAPAPGRRRVVMHAAEEQVATALDELTTTNSCCKIVRNGQIIIIRNGVQFDVTGRQIK